MTILLLMLILNTVNSVSAFWVRDIRFLGIINFLGWSLATLHFLMVKGVLQ